MHTKFNTSLLLSLIYFFPLFSEPILCYFSYQHSRFERKDTVLFDHATIKIKLKEYLNNNDLFQKMRDQVYGAILITNNSSEPQCISKTTVIGDSKTFVLALSNALEHISISQDATNIYIILHHSESSLNNALTHYTQKTSALTDWLFFASIIAIPLIPTILLLNFLINPGGIVGSALTALMAPVIARGLIRSSIGIGCF